MKLRRHARWLLVLAAWLGNACAQAAPTLLDFSPEERRLIQRHGPWPPTPVPDPGNRHSSNPEAVALGRMLFLNPRLAADGRTACATCHAPGFAYADGLRRAIGNSGSLLARNTPSLWNASQQRWLGWDGAFDSLWSQALHPLAHPHEMASSGAVVQRVVAADAELACRWQRVFGGLPAGPAPAAPATPAAEEGVLVQAAKALGAFVASLVSGRTPFDDFRNAIARNDTAAAAQYPMTAQRGLRLFIGPGRCASCHTGPMFSNGEFADIGLPYFSAPGVVDAGRFAGIAALKASRFNLLSPLQSDAVASSPEATKTRHVVSQHRHFGEFKVPSLRNVELTAPYGHDGQVADLAAMLAHYNKPNLERLHADGEQLIAPLGWTAEQQADVVAFLRTLTDPRAEGWRGPALGRCGSGALMR